MEVAKCSKCRQVKDIEQFLIRSDTGERRGVCHTCRKVYQSKWDKNNAEKTKERRRKKFFRYMSVHIFKSSEYEQALRDLAEQGKYVCPYTGAPLIPGDGMHLDHIKSKALHPELSKNLSNLMWISEWANWAKGMLSPQEFVDKCQSVVKYTEEHGVPKGGQDDYN